MDLDHWDNAAGAIVTLVTTYGLRVLGAIVILVGGWIGSRVLYRLVARLCGRTEHIDRTVTLFLADGAKYLTIALTLVAVLTTFGIATTSFVAVLGAFGVGVGLALQGTLSNLAAGIMLIVIRPFHIGDRIETGGVAGRTQEINLFYTEIDSDDGARIVIPNGKLWGEIVRVPTRNSTARIELRYPRPASEDIGSAIARLTDLIGRDKRVRRVANVGVDSLGDGTYTLLAHAWVDQGDQQAVQLDLNRAAKEEFDRKPAKASPAPVERSLERPVERPLERPVERRTG
ncbi:MAG: mechanosensitive ion channel [Alphaproteobacteria bacterium]|nr:mechanosensitive ion channel [Alphaproteobacteria bacterium]